MPLDQHASEESASSATGRQDRRRREGRHAWPVAGREDRGRRRRGDTGHAESAAAASSSTRAGRRRRPALRPLSRRRAGARLR